MEPTLAPSFEELIPALPEIGLAAGAGSIGCFVVPWLTGILGDQAGIAFAVKWLSVWAVAIALGGAVILRGRARTG